MRVWSAWEKQAVYEDENHRKGDQKEKTIRKKDNIKRPKRNRSNRRRADWRRPTKISRNIRRKDRSGIVAKEKNYRDEGGQKKCVYLHNSWNVILQMHSKGSERLTEFADTSFASYCRSSPLNSNLDWIKFGIWQYSPELNAESGRTWRCRTYCRCTFWGWGV